MARSLLLWDKFPIMFLLKDTRETHASYNVFEDNSRALELAHLPKLLSHIKHEDSLLFSIKLSTLLSYVHISYTIHNYINPSITGTLYYYATTIV
jgi:hypothetical protein